MCSVWIKMSNFEALTTAYPLWTRTSKGGNAIIHLFTIEGK